MKKTTKVINLISGPGTGKSTMAALLFVHMKVAGMNVEYVPEFAKRLVWKKDFETLNNRYYVSRQQFELLKSMDGIVDYVITDGSLLHGLHYNKTNPDNTSDIIKTENKILNYVNQFNNVNVFLERNPSIPYEHAGRIQSWKEAQESDLQLKKILEDNEMPYFDVISDIGSIDKIMDYVKGF